MRSEDAFLTAIRDDPDDDNVRLIFADWFEERGDPRGAFLRGQVQLARLAQGDPMSVALRGQEFGLLALHRHEWLGVLPDYVNHWQFVRGLLHVEAHAPAFMDNIHRFNAVLPWIERLSLSFLDASHLGTLAAMPHVSCLMRLDIALSRVGNAGADAIGGSGVFAPLRWLDLNCNKLTNAGAAAIALSPHLTRLTALHLGFNDVGPKVVPALVNSANVVNLKALDLSYNRLGDTGARAVARSKQFGTLECLYLSGNSIGREGALALAESDTLPKLTTLHLSGNELTPASRAALVRRFGEGVRC